jgi:inhibitor of cysteine peptidase
MRSLCALLLAVYSFWVHGADIMTVYVNPEKAKQFQVKLPANPTTGFQWSIKKYDHNILELAGSLYIAPNTKLIGAGGEMVYTFKLIEGKAYPRSTKLEFTYARSWEPNTATSQQVTVEFSQSSASK